MPGASSSGDLDVAIVGAGLSGVALAAVLGRTNIRVGLFDPHPAPVSAFKAEKIEPDQAGALRRLGLLAGLQPEASRIRAVLTGRGGRILCVTPIEQYGISYPALVGAIARQIPPRVERVYARVEHLELSDDAQSLVLGDGRRRRARLAVLASGTAKAIAEGVGLVRRVVSKDHSFNLGFDVAPAGPGGPPSRGQSHALRFDSVTYYADSGASRFDYLTLFPIPGRLRANLFTYHGARDAWVRAFMRDPTTELEILAPGLASLLGRTAASPQPVGLTVTSRVETGAVDLYVSDPPGRPGFVPVGDAGQNVCPTTGTGLTKVLADVEVLAGLIPGWLATPGMSAAKLAAFFEHPLKRSVDGRSLAGALYLKRLILDESWTWKFRRAKNFALMRARGVLRGAFGELHPAGGLNVWPYGGPAG